jgi:hypothetical protein
MTIYDYLVSMNKFHKIQQVFLDFLRCPNLLLGECIWQQSKRLLHLNFLQQLWSYPMDLKLYPIKD